MARERSLRSIIVLGGCAAVILGCALVWFGFAVQDSELEDYQIAQFLERQFPPARNTTTLMAPFAPSVYSLSLIAVGESMGVGGAVTVVMVALERHLQEGKRLRSSIFAPSPDRGTPRRR
jgi:hypothetical protein